jgi:hypothetical protein
VTTHSPDTTQALADKPRRVSAGDTAGSTRPRRIRKNTVKAVVAARQNAQLALVNDILQQPETSPV